MFDVHVRLANAPGQLALLGEALGKSGISLEGGGVFTRDGLGDAHFLVEDGEGAKSALEAEGLHVLAVNEVLVRKLRQDVPGQLGAIAAALAAGGININTMYSDHSNQLILVVDELARAAALTSRWDISADRS